MIIMMIIIIVNKNNNNSNKMVIIIIIIKMIIVTIVMIYEFRCNRRSLYHLKTHNQPGSFATAVYFCVETVLL